MGTLFHPYIFHMFSQSDVLIVTFSSIISHSMTLGKTWAIDDEYQSFRITTIYSWDRWNDHFRIFLQ